MNFPIAPPQASQHAFDHDLLFYTITALTVFFTVVVLTLVLVFAIRYRSWKKIDRSNAPHHNLKLELGWTVIPLILGLAIFAWGAIEFVDIHEPPADAMEIFVIGKQWMWHAQHANGVRENNTLHVPVGRPVKLTMISQDVIHAFYIPAFRVQYHVVPGRYTTIWFTPTKPGRYNLWCSMHCGTQHSEMGGYVYVMPQDEFQRWLARGGERVEQVQLTMAQEGERTFNLLACGNCHGSQDGPRGPTLNGLLGRSRQFTDGSRTVADEQYIRESILNPYTRLTAGYDRTMPEYRGQLSEEKVLQLLAYIKTLGQGGPNAVPAAAPAVQANSQPAANPSNGRTSIR